MTNNQNNWCSIWGSEEKTLTTDGQFQSDNIQCLIRQDLVVVFLLFFRKMRFVSVEGWTKNPFQSGIYCQSGYICSISVSKEANEPQVAQEPRVEDLQSTGTDNRNKSIPVNGCCESTVYNFLDVFHLMSSVGWSLCLLFFNNLSFVRRLLPITVMGLKTEGKKETPTTNQRSAPCLVGSDDWFSSSPQIQIQTNTYFSKLVLLVVLLLVLLRFRNVVLLRNCRHKTTTCSSYTLLWRFCECVEALKQIMSFTP